MSLRKKEKLKKAVIIIGASIVSAILLLGLTTFLIVRSYIRKMNLVTLEEDYSPAEAALEPEVEPESEDMADEAYNSPQEEVDTVKASIRRNIEDNNTPIISDKDVTNILLIGSDARKKGGTGRSDTIILFSINKSTRTITATSILRDIYLQIPYRKNDRINVAYAMGGAKLLMDTIEQNFKIQVDRFAAVDFYAFIDIVDTIGGVTLDVTEEELPVINDYVAEINLLTGEEKSKDQLTEAGALLLNGKQTLGYVRDRYVGNNDFERTSRQREVLKKIFDGVKGLRLSEINRLLNVFLPQVTTNFTEGELFSMILDIPAYTKYDFQQWSIPVNGSYKDMRIDRKAVLSIDFEVNIKELQSRIYNID